MLNQLPALIAIIFVAVTTLCQPQVCFGQLLILNQKTFYDKGVNGPIPSHTMLVPQGWDVEGSARWGASKYYNTIPSQDIRMTSPAGFGVHVGSNLNATDYVLNQTAISQGYTRPADMAAENGRIVLARPNSLQQWRSAYERVCFPNHRKRGMTNLRVVEVESIPELKSAIDHQMGPIKQQVNERNGVLRASNVVQSCDCDAVAVRFSYSEDGIAKEAINVFGVHSVLTTSNLGTQIDWNVHIDVILSAPQGKLDSSLTELVSIATSVREVPAWTQKVQEHLAKLRGIEMRGFAERQKIMSDTFTEISRIQNEGYQRRSRSSDRSHSRYIDAIREVDRYSQGGYQYELPSGYENVFGDGNGNFILSDNASFDPNTDLETSSNWTSLSSDR